MNNKILVIDDEEGVRKLLKKILTKSGYDVFLAPDGKDALTFLETQYVDLIILDMNMPRMNGLEFLKILKSKYNNNTPVLMVTGSSDVDLRIKSYKLGVYDFIRKPELTEVMLKRIENGIKIGEMINFNEFIKIELLMAKKLQKYLFPDPSVSTGKLDLLAWHRPLSDIGGDLYDYIVFENKKIMFFVADVSGHSISAALFTAIVKMVFRNALKVAECPGDIMTIMNRELTGNLPIESFVTMFCGLFDPSDGKLEYSNAGHPKPFSIIGGNVEEISGHDPFLGPIQNAEFACYEKYIKPGESILLYTDGVLDVMDNNDNSIGKELLMKTIKSESMDIMEKFEELKTNILSEKVSITDDCTIMLLDYK